MFLKFDRVNIARTEFTLNKMDWSEFQNRTNKWRVDYRQNSEQTIDENITKLQKFILSAYKRSSTYHHPNKRDMVGENDQAAINKLIRLRNYYKRRPYTKETVIIDIEYCSKFALRDFTNSRKRFTRMPERSLGNVQGSLKLTSSRRLPLLYCLPPAASMNVMLGYQNSIFSQRLKAEKFTAHSKVHSSRAH